MNKSYARHGQDLWVLENLHEENGYFVDIGAFDGITDSNSYLLEQMGWFGVCVEPNSRAYSLLTENRNCITFDYAISDKIGYVDFVERGRRQQASGIYHTEADPHVKNIVEQKNHPLVKKESITLLKLLEISDAPKVIDYLSIDVEGGEWLIFKDFEFDKYKFLTITVEHNYFHGTGFNEQCKIHRDNIRNKLSSHGYTYAKTVDADDWFILD